MKHLYRITVAVTFALLGMLLFTLYPEKVYSMIFRNKIVVSIPLPGGMEKQEFLGILKSAAADTDTGVMYVNVRNATSLKPDYLIYTTQISEDFIGLPNSYPSREIQSNDTLSTETGDYDLLGRNIGYTFFFYDLSEAEYYDLSNGLFYVESECTRFLTALSAQGIDSYGQEEVDVGVFDETMLVFVALGIFIVLFSLHYANSRSREILIKRIHGYSVMGTWKSVFFSELLLAAGISLLIGVVPVGFYAYSFGMTAFCFAKWAAPVYFGFLSLILLLSAAGTYVFVCSLCPTEIRQQQPKKWFQALTAAVRFLSIITGLFGLTYTYVTMQQYIGSQNCYEAAAPCRSFVTVTCNLKGTEFTNDLLNKLYSFTERVQEQFRTYVIYWDEEEELLTVSRNYFDLQPCILSDGTMLTADALPAPDGSELILEPEHSDSHEDHLNEVILHYRKEQRFFTVDPLNIDSGGIVTDPSILIADEAVMRENAPQLLMNQFFFIVCESDDAYAELSPLIIEAGLQDVLTEAATVEEEFQEVLSNASQAVFYYALIGIVFLAMLIIVSVFESALYFEYNKRRLCIQFLHGYGAEACRTMWIVKIITYAASLVISIYCQLVLFFLAAVAVLDIFLFITEIDALKSHNMAEYLKGEM